MPIVLSAILSLILLIGSELAYSAQKPVVLEPKTHSEQRNYYLVKPGDTLSAISLATGHSWQQLADWNHLKIPYLIYAGTRLKLFPSAEKKSTENLNSRISRDKKSRPNNGKNTVPLKQKNLVKPLVKPQLKSDLKEKKSTISNTQKKMLKLSFNWPLKGSVLRKFSETNKQGIDIENKIKNQKVLAAAEGVVVYVGKELSTFKNLVIIKHQAGFLSAYANTSRLLVKEGAHVASGQTIAEMSALGSKNILHFEIRKNGNPVDPAKLLPN